VSGAPQGRAGRLLCARRGALLIGAPFLVLYLSTLTADHNYGGVVSAMMAERAVGSGTLSVELFNPAHVPCTGAAAGPAAAANGACFIRPALSHEANPGFRVAQLAARRTAPADAILVASFPDPRLKVYLPCFALRRAVVPEFFFGTQISEEESLRRLEGMLAAACREGAALFALSPLVEDGPEAVGAFPAGRVRAHIRTLEPEPVASGDGLTVCRLRRCPG